MNINRFRSAISIFVGCYLLLSCGEKQFKRFDNQKWKNDKYGCNGDRKILFVEILKRKTEILGYTEVDILKNFGKPDLNDLRRRQQKFYYYYINNSHKCQRSIGIDTIIKFRFNAMDQVNEIVVESD